MSPPSTPKKEKHTYNVNNNFVGPSTAAWDDHLPVPKLGFMSAAAVVFGLALLCFVNSHNAEFAFDDSEAIVKNQDLRPETPIGQLFAHDFWGSNLASNTSHKSYRPLTVLTFRWNYILAGGLHPWGFHVVNIVLHAVVSVILLQVISVFFSGQLLDSRGHVTFRVPRASLLAAMLFAVHPIHTESVAGVVGRADLMCAITMLFSFLCYTRACHTGRGYSSRQPSQTLSGWLTLSMLLAAMSVLFKEQGITILGICSAYDVLIQCHIDLIQIVGLRPQLPPSPPPRSPHRNKAQQNGVVPSQFQGPWVRPLFLRHVALAVTGLLILVGRWRVMGSAPPTFQVVDNPHSFVDGFVYRVINYNYLYALNTWLLVNPWWLCFDWSMGCVPVITSLTDLRIIPTAVFWVALTTIIYVCLARNPCREVRVATIGLAVLIVPFLPATNIFFRVGFVIAERILYMSSAGLCILVTLGATLMSKQPKYREIVRMFIYIILVLFIARSIMRSEDWKSEKILFQAGVKVCPLNAKVHYNIAKVNGDSGNTNRAIEEYELAIQLSPEYDQAMNNLGNIMKELGRLTEAERHLEKATQIRPDFAAALMNLAIVQAALNKTGAAEVNYRRALTHRRKYPDCYYNLGNLYLDMGRHKEALTAWRNATLQKPEHLSAWSNMIILLDQLGRLDEMEIAAREALMHLPREATLYYNIGNAYGKASRYADSEVYFKQAVNLDPTNANYHSNLGVLYHRWGKLQKAAASYTQALKLDPNSQITRDNLDMLQRRMAKDSGAS